MFIFEGHKTVDTGTVDGWRGGAGLDEDPGGDRHWWWQEAQQQWVYTCHQQMPRFSDNF